jgi:hypothetical protein
VTAFRRQFGKCGHDPGFYGADGLSAPLYQKSLSRPKLSVQQFFQIIQLNLLGAIPLEELLKPRRRQNDNPYCSSLLDLVA